MKITKDVLKEKLEKAETPLNNRGLGFQSTLNEAALINNYTQEEVNYVGLNVFRHYGMCGGCTFFLRKVGDQDSACRVVTGPISSLGACQLYINGTIEAEMQALQLAIQIDFSNPELDAFALSEKENEKAIVDFVVNIAKADKARQIVYGIVLEPDEVDTQGDTISKEEVELAAHKYALTNRVIGESHEKEAQAKPVESYITSEDITLGDQVVKAGSWVMAVKVFDSKLWAGVESGEFTGFSIGAMAKRRPYETTEADT